ncbi:AAA family ATPase [Nostocoides sp. F2B08]|uniref:ATP-binding protein n=1 Tax=Nostocoides sp. F2B08 TaxID=2653936 RepID=UPI0012639DBB|nr:adenylate/guanylate cyclase domain-containing protein [Tetrasphaera sp. F2B08]KAB7743219.1 AAA family ATPase [Tetrasphaera sp. F2B08]
MSVNGPAGELDALDQGIAALERQRETLGDSVVDAALRPLLQRRERLSAHPGDRRKLVTVLFSDLVDSTPLTAALGDEAMRELMGRYFGLWREAVEAQGGHVLKFIGDAVVGVFGMDRAREDDPHRAVRAAVSVQPDLARLADEVRTEHGQALRTRVGIDTGDVVLGSFDERGDGDVVVVGATVNRAARLQTAAPPDGILLSSATARHVRGSFGLQDHGELDLKGLDRPVRTYLVHSAAESGFWSTARGLEGVSTRTIGRDVELKLLAKLFEDTVEERASRVVTVVGDAGIGKSRLLADLEAWLASLPDTVWLLRGRADPSADGMPHGLVRSAFAERFSIQDTDPPAEVLEKWHKGMAAMSAGAVSGAEDLIGWLGFTTTDTSATDTAPLDPAALQHRAWSALDATMRAMCDEAPVVLLLEDLHWADRPVLDLLIDVQARPRAYPLLVVATARPTLLEQHPHWGEGLSGHREVRLQPLSRREAGLLVSEILHELETVPDWVREVVVDATEGNPFFVEEVIAWFVDTGTIGTGPGGWTVLPSPPNAAAVPGTLRAVLEARLDTLSRSERDLVDRASVIGRVFWDAAVAHLAEGLPAPSAQAYDALRRREVVHQRPSSAFAHAHEFAFRHALLRDVAYDGLLSPVRRTYHARAAAWVLETARASGRLDEHAGTVAQHLLAAGEEEAAAPWLLSAARHAARTYANDEALTLLDRAAAGTRDDLRFEVLLEKERVLDRTGRRDEQRAVLDSLVEAAGDDLGRRAKVLLVRGRWLFFHAEYADAVRVSSEAAALAEKAGLRTDEVEAWIMGGRSLAFASEHLKARRHLQAALDMAREAGTMRQVGETLRLLGVVATNLHEERLAVDLLEESADAFRQVRDEEGQALVSGQLAAVHMLAGRMEEAKVHSEAALAVFTANGHLLRQGIVLGNLNSIALDTGRLDEALVTAVRAVELSERVEDFEGIVSSLQRLGEAERLTGAGTTAREHLERAVQLGRQHSLHYFVCHALASLSALALDESRPADALSLAEEARASATLSDIPLAIAKSDIALGLAALATGDTQTAVHALTAASDRTRLLGVATETVQSEAFLADALATATRVEEARALARKAFVAMGPNGPEPCGEPHPGRALIACHRALEALGDPWAREVPVVAARFLTRRAALVEDAAVRERFLQIPDCRALAELAGAAG